jgi:flagellar hook-basal body complex protein FliE
MPAPIDPSMLTTGAEWQIPSLSGPAPQEAQEAGGSGFGDALSNAIESLQATQSEAAAASRQLATGQAEDPTAVIMAVEQARLSMEFASTIRNKAVEAYQEIFRSQV